MDKTVACVPLRWVFFQISATRASKLSNLIHLLSRMKGTRPYCNPSETKKIGKWFEMVIGISFWIIHDNVIKRSNEMRNLSILENDSWSHWLLQVCLPPISGRSIRSRLLIREWKSTSLESEQLLTDLSDLLNTIPKSPPMIPLLPQEFWICLSSTFNKLRSLVLPLQYTPEK